MEKNTDILKYFFLFKKNPVLHRKALSSNCLFVLPSFGQCLKTLCQRIWIYYIQKRVHSEDFKRKKKCSGFSAMVQPLTEIP